MKTRTAFSSFLFLTVVLLVSAGCLTGDGGQPVAPSNEPRAEAGGEAETWNASAHDSVTFTLGAGTATHGGVLVAEGCEKFVIDVPQGTTRAAFTVSAPAVNGTQPGAGYATIEVSPPSEADPHRPSEDGRPAEERRVTLQDPRSGTWELRVLPEYATANNIHHVSAQLEGAGQAPEERPRLTPNCI
jgi:hypothetical protein